MAPELYEEHYDCMIDIYAFGMCVLEMLTKEYPYGEVGNTVGIMKLVMEGVLPQSLARVKDEAALDFIKLCLYRRDLLSHLCLIRIKC